MRKFDRKKEEGKKKKNKERKGKREKKYASLDRNWTSLCCVWRHSDNTAVLSRKKIRNVRGVNLAMLLLPQFRRHHQIRSGSSYGFVILKIAQSSVRKMFRRFCVEPRLVLREGRYTFVDLHAVRKFVYRTERIYLTSWTYSWKIQSFSS